MTALRPLPNARGWEASSPYGTLTILPNRSDWRKRHAYWRAWDLGRRWVGPWRPTPALAIAAALSRLAGAVEHGAVVTPQNRKG